VSLRAPFACHCERPKGARQSPNALRGLLRRPVRASSQWQVMVIAGPSSVIAPQGHFLRMTYVILQGASAWRERGNLQMHWGDCFVTSCLAMTGDGHCGPFECHCERSAAISWKKVKIDLIASCTNQAIPHSQNWLNQFSSAVNQPLFASHVI